MAEKLTAEGVQCCTICARPAAYAGTMLPSAVRYGRGVWPTHTCYAQSGTEVAYGDTATRSL
eukprot:141836-Rhodomonas_salina.1